MMWQAKQNSSRRKQSKTKSEREEQENRSTSKNISGAAAAVCGRVSIVGRGSTYYVVGLVPCYPVCLLLPALSAVVSLRPLPSPLPIPLDATHNGCGRVERTV